MEIGYCSNGLFPNGYVLGEGAGKRHLLGKYSKPQEEERIFMFMDLKSSTEIAEKLGHLQYSSFVRDSIMDINQELSSFNVQKYINI